MWHPKQGKATDFKLHVGTVTQSEVNDHTHTNVNNRQTISMELPKLAVTNVRSLLPHIKAFMEDIIDINIDVFIVCEVWEKAVYPELYKSLEYYLEMKGLEFVSCGASKNKTRSRYSS